MPEKVSSALDSGHVFGCLLLALCVNHGSGASVAAAYTLPSEVACRSDLGSQSCELLDSLVLDESEEEAKVLRMELLQLEYRHVSREMAVTAISKQGINQSAQDMSVGASGMKTNAVQDPAAVVILPSPRPFPKPHVDSPEQERNRLLSEVAIPVSAFLFGQLMLLLGQNTAAMLAIYFGGQSGFSLYMKLVLSGEMVSRKLGLRGMPAAFLITAVQQVVAFGSMALAMVVLYFTRWRYIPRRLSSFKEIGFVLAFSAAVAVNIGLNNFSMALLPVSLNLVIRSCIPLVTLLLQTLARQVWSATPASGARFSDVILMAMGVACAAIAAFAESESKHPSGESRYLVLGVVMCVLSDFAAAATLILAAAFGKVLDPPLTPLDTIFYMGLPCAMILLPASFLVHHPVSWHGFGPMTDWQVFEKVMEISPLMWLSVIVSGLISGGYNFIQYTVVQRLSAGHAAFAGNFNKAATISLSLWFGLEFLPGGIWSLVMLLGIAGSILSFTAWSYLQSSRAKGAKASK